MKTVIVNDTSTSGHFGCRLVMAALNEQLKHRGMDVVGSILWTENWKDHIELLDRADLIVVNGEGSIHHGRRMDLLEIAGSYPSILINAVYQDVPKNEHIKQFKYVSVRESLSKEAMQQHGVTPDIVPDLIFSHDIPKPQGKGRGLINSVNRQSGLNPFDPDFINKMGKYESICSGRFHAVCLAMMWGMPFSAYPSNTHKTLGMLTDAKALDHYFTSQEEAKGNIKPFDSSGYVAEARETIMNQDFIGSNA